MPLEHIALNLPAAAAATEWYCQHLGLKVIRQQGPPTSARFLADAAGKTMLEFYQHPTVPAPDYRSIHPQSLHLAFSVAEVRSVRTKLIQAGATAEGEIIHNDDGDELAMLRDPWGVPVQLVKRAQPML